MKYLSLLAAIAIAFAFNNSAQAQQQRMIGGGGPIKIDNPGNQDGGPDGQTRRPAAGTVLPPAQVGPPAGGSTLPPIIDQGPPIIDQGQPFIDQGIPNDGIFEPNAVIGGDSGIQGKPDAQLIAGEGQAFTCPKLGCRAKIIDGGLEILDVNRGGIASRLGLQNGDCITHINNVLIDSGRQYGRCLSDAPRLHDGWLNMRVKDVRFDQGYNVAEYVNVRGWIGGQRRITHRIYQEPVIIHQEPVYNQHIIRRNVYNGRRSCGGRH